ncbi:MAG TPA: hypothetical protein DCS24_07960 [Erythrobacter sp.]|nr:hypothetical protein [Erythrobacter sp.]
MLTILGAIALMQASTDAAPTSAPPACDTQAHAGFDMWIGEWDVHPAAQPERKVAESRIERAHAGCAILERWMPLSGTGGSSTSHYDPATEQWHQKWVGSSPESVEFTGGVVDGKMVIAGWWMNVTGPGQHALIRMSYSKNEDGSVRQHGEASTDHGVSWQTAFDFIYRSRERASE